MDTLTLVILVIAGLLFASRWAPDADWPHSLGGCAGCSQHSPAASCFHPVPTLVRASWRDYL